MSKVIIGIHGLGNKPPKGTLEKWWRLAIEEGLVNTGKPVPAFTFELVYWADVLHKKPLDENCTDPTDPLCLKEKYLPSSGMFIPEDHSKRRKVLDFLSDQLDTLFLNEDYSLNYSFITDAILKHWVTDLEAYYMEKCNNDPRCHAKEIIRQRTIEIIRKYEKDEIMIIGHSMGSIIGYDVLAFDLHNIWVDTFATIGSPLGLPVVKSKIAAERKQNHFESGRLTTPAPVQRCWYNFSDLEDKVAFNYELSDDFTENKKGVKPLDFIVNNDYEINNEPNPHKSYGYLRTPEFAIKLSEFLEYQKPPVWKFWLKSSKHRKWWPKLISRINRNLRLR